jgi:hypothetical protein
MSYVVVKGKKAFSRLVGLPPALLDDVEAALQKLAEDPRSLGRRAVFPYPPSGQMYPFHCDYEGVRYYFVAFFYFSSDERALLVHDVTVAT